MIVAEQVVAALDGGLVTNAVNIPAVGAEDLEVLGPFVPLAGEARPARDGARAAASARGSRSTYYGELAEYDTRLLTVAALNGAFQGRVEQPVNYVNAPLVAAERGIEVVEEKRRAVARLHEPRSRVVGATASRVAGTTIGRDDRHWLVLGARLRARDGARAAHGLPAATTTCPA